MTKFEALQFQFAELKKRDKTFWDDLFSMAKTLTSEFARYIQVPLKTSLDDSSVPNLAKLGKLVNGKFVRWTLSEIKKDDRYIDFAFALMVDPTPSIYPPNQLGVSLRVSYDENCYVVNVGTRTNAVRVSDGGFSDLNSAIYNNFQNVLISAFDLIYIKTSLSDSAS